MYLGLYLKKTKRERTHKAMERSNGRKSKTQIDKQKKNSQHQYVPHKKLLNKIKLPVSAQELNKTNLSS